MEDKKTRTREILGAAVKKDGQSRLYDSMTLEKIRKNYNDMKTKL